MSVLRMKASWPRTPDGADDEGDRGRELEDDEAVAQPPPSRPRSARALDGRDGTEGRDEQGRIAPRGRADDGGEKDQGGHQGGVAEGVEDDVPLDERPESRQGGQDEPDGQGQGHEGQDHGVAEELADELALARPDDLAQADLLGPLEGPGRGQVHVVDAGDDQDEDGDRGEEEDEAGVADQAEIEIGPGMEVDAGQGLEEEARRLAAVWAVSRGPVGGDEGRELGLQGLRVGAVLEEDVGVVGAVAPDGQVALLELGHRLEGRDDVHGEMGVGGDVAEDAGDLETRPSSC